MADEHSAQTVFGAALKAEGYDLVLTGSGGVDMPIRGEYYQAGLRSSSVDNWSK